MTITLETVIEEMALKRRARLEVLRSLEGLLLDARDKGTPIYLTNYRVKRDSHTYLKVKRCSSTHLSKIRDTAGMRILCLFEEDVFIVHAALVDILKNNGYTLETLKVYNFDPLNGKVTQALADAIDAFPSIVPAPLRKESGYKSIHYLATIGHSGGQYDVEIQLRTLFQDVWGELEHTIAYKKGNIHPHIKKSFQLLSNDIENSDQLISHLRSITNREKITDQQDIERMATLRCYSYEDHRVPKVFQRKKTAKTAYQNYLSIVGQQPPISEEEFLCDAGKALEAVNSCITKTEAAEPTTKYWCDMESAYLLYCAKEYPEARKRYNNLLPEFKDSYIIPFRLGEIAFITSGEEANDGLANDTLAQALNYFDLCERVMMTSKHPATPSNAVAIKSKIALYYWSLGSGYFPLAIERTKQALKIYREHTEQLPQVFEVSLPNNMCYYNLEQFISLAEPIGYMKPPTEDSDETDLQRKIVEGQAREAAQHYTVAKEHFLTLKSLLDVEMKHDDPRSNVLDTAAWFSFHAYKYGDTSHDFLALAREYCRTAVRLKQFGHSSYRSFSTHMNHYQIIMSEQFKA